MFSKHERLNSLKSAVFNGLIFLGGIFELLSFRSFRALKQQHKAFSFFTLLILFSPIRRIVHTTMCNGKRHGNLLQTY